MENKKLFWREYTAETISIEQPENGNGEYSITVKVCNTYTKAEITTTMHAYNTQIPADKMREAIDTYRAVETSHAEAVNDMHDLNGKIQVCVDCLYASEYGTGSELADPDHADRYTEARQHGRIDVDTTIEPTAFSKSKCEYCGGILAGERYTAYYTATGY